jgi:hypothetical protein
MSPIDINTADESELMLLSGIGSTHAVRIIAARPFENPQELLSRGIIPPRTYFRNTGKMYVSAAEPTAQARTSAGSLQAIASPVPEFRIAVRARRQRLRRSRQRRLLAAMNVERNANLRRESA